MEKHDHEEVLFCFDRPTGLQAIIAIHDTTLGPALGGTRMWPYATEAEALNDVLRLSRGMTYKSSLAGLDLGGGKAVIIGDARTQKTEAMFRRFGQFVDSLNGRYITAEDVGMSVTEMVNIQKETNNVAGLPEEMGGSGDPSPVTAYGVYCGMKAAAKTAYGSDDLNGRKVSVQGAGNVGQASGGLPREGGRQGVPHGHPRREARRHQGRIPGDHHRDSRRTIYDLDVDIYSPCALGATVNDDTLKRLKCSVIAGAANNQLADEIIHGKAVMEKGILYAPDFLINAGGIINCAWERKGYNRKAAMKPDRGHPRHGHPHLQGQRRPRRSPPTWPRTRPPNTASAACARQASVSEPSTCSIAVISASRSTNRCTRIGRVMTPVRPGSRRNCSTASNAPTTSTSRCCWSSANCGTSPSCASRSARRSGCPPPEDLNPNRRFVDNPLLEALDGKRPAAAWNVRSARSAGWATTSCSPACTRTWRAVTSMFTPTCSRSPRRTIKS